MCIQPLRASQHASYSHICQQFCTCDVIKRVKVIPKGK